MVVARFFIAFMTTIVVCMSFLAGTGSAHSMKVLGGGGDPSMNEFEDEETMEGRLVVFEGGENLTMEDVLNTTCQLALALSTKPILTKEELFL